MNNLILSLKVKKQLSLKPINTHKNIFCIFQKFLFYMNVSLFPRVLQLFTSIFIKSKNFNNFALLLVIRYNGILFICSYCRCFHVSLHAIRDFRMWMCLGLQDMVGKGLRAEHSFFTATTQITIPILLKTPNFLIL